MSYCMMSVTPAAGRRDETYTGLQEEAKRARGLPGVEAFDVYESTAGEAFWIFGAVAGDAGAELAGSLSHRLEQRSSGLLAAPIEVHRLDALNVVGSASPPGSLSVFAVLQPAAGMRASILELLDIMMAETRREPGNCHYDLYESPDNGSLWMFEAYSAEAALLAHRASPYYQTNVPQVVQKLTGAIRVQLLAGRDCASRRRQP